MRIPIKLVSVTAVLSLGIGLGVAQNYAIKRSTSDGGGGTSGGGKFTLTGTIGQPDASVPASGAQYAIAGGFWGAFTSIQAPGAPRLSIAYDAGADLVTVSWELPAVGWVLDESPTLGLGRSPWEEVPTETYQSNATHRFVTFPNPGGSGFFRLRR